MDDGSQLVDQALARTIAPAKLADVLAGSLNELAKSPEAASRPKTSGTSGQPLTVNTVPALGLDTSAGRLLVTKDTPHRVLRLETYNIHDDLAGLKDQLKNGKTPTAPRKVTTGPLASGSGEAMGLTPVTADAAGKMFDTLVQYTDELKDATDRGITFALNGAGAMDCSAAGCTATQKFTGTVTPTARKERLTKGEVTAVMNATFTIDGKPAGQCTSPQRTFPLQGDSISGTLDCSNPQAGPLYSSVAARVQAQAQVDAQACGCKVTLTYPLRATTFIDARALAAVEAGQLLDQVRKERDSTACEPAPGTPASPAAWHPGTSSPAPTYRHVHAAAWQSPAAVLTAPSCPDPTWGGKVKYLRDGQGRLHEMNATLTRDMLDKGAEANRKLKIPGFSGGTSNQARGHILAKRLGGSGDIRDNLFTITQNPTNSPMMSADEGKIYDAVAKGETVTYNVYPEYADSTAKIPKYVQMEASGDRGFKLDIVLDNPAYKQE